jgi:hypothetical protein
MAVVVIAASSHASAQDLFELEVFEFETTAPGTYAVGLHANGVPQPDRRPETPAATHHPVHMSMEVTRGWTDGWTISLAAGHCVTSSEPWVVRSVVGFRFGS